MLIDSPRFPRKINFQMNIGGERHRIEAYKKAYPQTDLALLTNML